jgi:hypothetical protein
VLQQRASDAAALAGRRDVGVADQHDVAHGLDPHHARQRVAVAPERDAGGDLGVELAAGHVRLVPAVGRDDAAVRLGGGVDDRQDRVALVVAAGSDHRSVS